MVCKHLRELERQIVAAGFREIAREAPRARWREWVYFDCQLPLAEIRARLALADCVQDLVDPGAKFDAAASGFVCTEHLDGVMGRHPEEGPTAARFLPVAAGSDPAPLRGGDPYAAAREATAADDEARDPIEWAEVDGARLLGWKGDRYVRRSTLLSRDRRRLAVIGERANGQFRVELFTRTTSATYSQPYWQDELDPSVTSHLAAAEHIARERLERGSGER